MLRAALPLLFLLSLAAVATAQLVPRRLGCGNAVRAEDVPALELADSRRREVSQADKVGTWYFVPIQFHIVRRSNGNAGLDPSDTVFILDTLNDDFAEMQMVFYSAAPINYIDDDRYYEEVDSDAEIDDLRSIDNVANWLNIYFVDHLADDDGELCGISSFSSIGRTQGIVVANDCTVQQGEPSTVTHEVGHYFDLYHTHEPAFAEECVDGSNCSWGGDKVCDTPADPELGSHNVVDCVYVGNERDSCNNDSYSPREHNFMSYSPHECRTQFTDGQVSRAISTLLGNRADHITIASISSEAVYVDWRAVGFEMGTSISPYDTLEEGIDWAQATGRSIVIVAGGSYPQSLSAVGGAIGVTIVPTAGANATFGD